MLILLCRHMVSLGLNGLIIIQCIMHNMIINHNLARVGPVGPILVASAQFWSSPGMLWHVYSIISCWYQWYAMVYFNSLVPGRFEWNCNFQGNLSDGQQRYCLWNCPQMNMDLTDDKSTLVQVMAWCCKGFVSSFVHKNITKSYSALLLRMPLFHDLTLNNG